MYMAIDILIGLIAFLHIYIMWMEMFAWTTRGPIVFRGFAKELFVPTKAMAANQGLYNGFLAAGLIWSLLITDSYWKINVALFFLGCISIAGIYGALTVTKKILYIQAVPALIGITMILIQK